ncbi:MAG: 1-(5-phosphoribosyl)-5-[(5-phosphoribosylamino)methylideneamino]imidazole-4-carboxamide isomerase [Gammaproteobacteria bacterium]
MIVIPAIDLYEGRCVRLFQGDFEQVTYYDTEPDTLAKRYTIAGAPWLHVVNLDGAKEGGSPDYAQLRTLCGIHGLNVQCGGGLRSQESIQRALQIGVQRAVIGSLVVSDPAALKNCLGDYGAEHITLALDVRITDNVPRLAIHGWQEQSTVTLWDTLDEYSRLGLTDVLCTDISRDGAMQGPNFELYAECVERFPNIDFQASGGVRGIEDLNALNDTGVAAAIVGRALYENPKLIEEARPFLPNA